MKKVIITTVFLFIGFKSYSQLDSLNKINEDFNIKIENLKNEFKDLRSSYNTSFSELENKLIDYINIQEELISQFEFKLKILENKTEFNFKSIMTSGELIDSLKNVSFLLKNEVVTNSKGLSQIDQQLNLVSSETNSKMILIDEKFSSKTLLGFILGVFSFLLALILFIVLRKKVTDSNSKFYTQITDSRKSIYEEHMRLDQKLIEVLESQLKLQSQKKETKSHTSEIEDHTLALKVADEIIRMQINITNMPEDTKGLKQLSRAIQRIQDSFKINGYEIIDMLGKSYNEGIKAAASFTIDNKLKKEEQIITRIIKPQVNFEGVMIQSAEIEVSIGE